MAVRKLLFVGCAVPTIFRACIFLYPLRYWGTSEHRRKKLATFRLICAPAFDRDLPPHKRTFTIALGTPQTSRGLLGVIFFRLGALFVSVNSKFDQEHTFRLVLWHQSQALILETPGGSPSSGFQSIRRA